MSRKIWLHGFTLLVFCHPLRISPYISQWDMPSSNLANIISMSISDTDTSNISYHGKFSFVTSFTSIFCVACICFILSAGGVATGFAPSSNSNKSSSDEAEFSFAFLTEILTSLFGFSFIGATKLSYCRIQATLPLTLQKMCSSSWLLLMLLLPMSTTASKDHFSNIHNYHNNNNKMNIKYQLSNN